MVCVVTVNYIRSGSFISHLFIEKPTSEIICTSKCSKKGEGDGGYWVGLIVRGVG